MAKPNARAKRKPAAVSITPQRMNFTFDEGEVPKHWFQDDPVLTHFLNALSLTFPDGERFFVDSVRAFRDQVKDKARQKDISGFIGQEAMHSLEHNTFNDFLGKQGYGDIARGGQSLALKLINRGRRRLSPKAQLAATAGLEHITAILADTILSDPAISEKMHASVRDLWLWHAIEETEHKAVAFDLYQDVCGDHELRVRTFTAATLFLTGYSLFYTSRFLIRDRMYLKPHKVVRGLWRMWGPNGLLTRIIPEYRDYYRRDFHPWDRENSELIAKWRKVLAIPAAA